MVIRKGDKFYFVLINIYKSKGVWKHKEVFKSELIFDDYFLCQKTASNTAKEKGLYFGIRKV